MVSALCFVTCMLSTRHSEFYSEWMCGFQSFYLNWSFISNTWLNGVIIFQIYHTLLCSDRLRRYRPPTHKEVIHHALAVYFYALIWGLICGFNLSFLPHSSHLYNGYSCMPMEYNTASTLFFFLVYVPLTLGLPLVYAIFVVFNIVRRKLLPPSGRRRALSLFLLRLAVLYFVIWGPFLVFFIIGNFVKVNPVIHWIGSVISHLQGLISAAFCLTNPDIFHSFWLIVTCQSDNTSHGGEGEEAVHAHWWSNHHDRNNHRGSRLSSRSSISRFLQWSSIRGAPSTDNHNHHHHDNNKTRSTTTGIISHDSEGNDHLEETEQQTISMVCGGGGGDKPEQTEGHELIPIEQEKTEVVRLEDNHEN